MGSFDWAMQKLKNSGLKDELDILVLEKKIPILGICVGMQLMANESEEGQKGGFGWIEGKVKKFTSKTKKLILPHMGWNNVELKKNTLIKENLNPSFYFLHSYYFDPEIQDSVLGETLYDVRFASIINKENIYGIKFHPEKSHDNGLNILRNFANL